MSALPAFVEQGQGRTAVLLLHGVGGGAAIWGDEEGSGTLRALAEAGYRDVALDLPGYGASAALGAPTMAAFVAGVRGVIAQVDAPATVLLGHSMGGMVAQEVAALAPAEVQGLVLACTSASFGKAEGSWQAQFLAQRLAPLDAGLGMAGMAQQLVPGLVSANAPDSARNAARAVMSRVPESTYRAALKAIVGFDRREALAALRVPTLLLAGEADTAAPPAVMQRMAERVAGSEFVCLAGAGHIANVEMPAAFNAAVLAFLRRHFPV